MIFELSLREVLAMGLALPAGGAAAGLGTYAYIGALPLSAAVMAPVAILGAFAVLAILVGVTASQESKQLDN